MPLFKVREWLKVEMPDAVVEVWEWFKVEMPDAVVESSGVAQG